jgi:hypothetical protein
MCKHSFHTFIQIHVEPIIYAPVLIVEHSEMDFAHMKILGKCLFLILFVSLFFVAISALLCKLSKKINVYCVSLQFSFASLVHLDIIFYKRALIFRQFNKSIILVLNRSSKLVLHDSCAN